MNFKRHFKMEEATDGVDISGGLVDDMTTTTVVDVDVTEKPQVETIQEGWMKGVEKALAEDPSLKSFKDINGLVKSYVNAQKLIGRDKIIVPDEHASDEDIQAFYNKLGRPDRDKYKVEFGEAEYDDDFKKEFLDAAHSNGLLPSQAQKVFEFWHNKVTEAGAAHSNELVEQQKAEHLALRKEWGAGFEKNLETAKVALRQFADDNIIQYMKDSGLGNNPQLIRLFAKIGESLNEDSFKDSVVKHLGMTKDEAQLRLDQIMTNHDHPYWKGVESAVNEVGKLHQVLES